MARQIYQWKLNMKPFGGKKGKRSIAGPKRNRTCASSDLPRIPPAIQQLRAPLIRAHKFRRRAAPHPFLCRVLRKRCPKRERHLPTSDSPRRPFSSSVYDGTQEASKVNGRESHSQSRRKRRDPGPQRSRPIFSLFAGNVTGNLPLPGIIETRSPISQRNRAKSICFRKPNFS